MYDEFANLLRSHPHIALWLDAQFHGEDSTSRPRTRPSPASKLPSTGEFERPLFVIPVSLEQFPSDEELHELLMDSGVSLKRSKEMVVRARATESASAFYLSEEITLDNFGLGTVVASDFSSFGMAALMGYEPCEGLRLVGSRFIASKFTGDVFEVLLVRDGRIIVMQNSNMSTRYCVRMYARRKREGFLGSLLRTAYQSSLVDCLKCCTPGRGAMRFCRCGEPQLPFSTACFNSWGDIAAMYHDRLEDAFVLQNVFTPSGTRIASLLAYRRQSMVQANVDMLPLFQALVLDNPDFQPTVEQPLVTVKSFSELYSRRSVAFDIKSRSGMGARKYSRGGVEIELLPEAGVEGLLKMGSMKDNDSRGGHRKFESIFKCELCSREFNARYNWKRHMMTVHANEREHECEACGLKFKLKNHLTAHVRQVHEGEKSHSCRICCKKFWSPSNLKRHVDEAHFKTRAFPCGHCAKGFASKYNLERHIAKAHASGTKSGSASSLPECEGSRMQSTVF